MNIRNFQHQELRIDEFTTTPGESWCILGENHSGIDSFIDLLAGKLSHCQANILDLPKNPGILSLVMIEVQSGAYLGEDDIVRFDDIYGRTPDAAEI